MNFASKGLAVALALSLTTPAVAQTADPAADPAMTTAPVENNDDEFPWGLLGLLGLAGLLGMKRRDRDDIYRTAGTGTGNINR